MSEDLQNNQPDKTSLQNDILDTSITPGQITAAADSGLAEEEIILEKTTVIAQTPQESPAETEAPKPTPAYKSFWREVLETVLLTILIFFMVKGLIANFRILGSSMEPNFHTGQLVLVNKAAYFHFDINAWVRLIPGVKAEGQNVVWMFGGPKRGDVIIFEPPDSHDEDYIKRVIGLPGERVEVRDGKVYINGTPIDEPYIKDAPISPYNASVVPPNHLFVMGDNRNGSRDSRSFGMLPIDLIVGKAMLVYFPFDKDWGGVPEVHYAPTS